MNRTTIYTMTANKWVDFTQPINGQIVGKIGVSVTGLDHGKQALKDERASVLQKVETSAEGKARYNYSIATSTEFSVDLFTKKDTPLSLRHVKEVKVAKASGAEYSVDAEVAKITEALKPLNKFLKEVEPKSNKRQHIEEWQEALSKILEEVNQKAQQLKITELKISSQEDFKTIVSLLSRNGFLRQLLVYENKIQLVILAAVWALIGCVFYALSAYFDNIMARLSCWMGEFSLQSISTSVLSDERNLTFADRDSCISEYLKSADENCLLCDLVFALGFSFILAMILNLCIRICCRR